MRLKAIKIGDNRAWSSTLTCRKRLLSKEACAFGGQLDLHINLLFLRSSDVHTQQWWWASRNPRSKSPENVHEVPTIAACRNFKKQAKYTFRFLAVLNFVGCFCYSAGMKARHQSLWSILTASIVLVRKKIADCQLLCFERTKSLFSWAAFSRFLRRRSCPYKDPLSITHDARELDWRRDWLRVTHWVKRHHNVSRATGQRLQPVFPSYISDLHLLLLAKLEPVYILRWVAISRCRKTDAEILATTFEHSRTKYGESRPVSE